MAGSFTVQLLGDDGGTARLVAVNAAGELVVAGSGGGLSPNQFEIETTLTNGATTAFADINLLPTMRLSPDLTVGQVAQPDSDYQINSLSFSTSTPGQPLELARTAALGTAGTKVEISTAKGVTVLTMSYSGATAATAVGVATTGLAVEYQISITFTVAAP